MPYVEQIPILRQAFQIKALPKQSTSGASSMLLPPPPPFPPFSFIFPAGQRVYQFQLGKQTSFNQKHTEIESQNHDPEDGLNIECGKKAWHHGIDYQSWNQVEGNQSTNNT